MLDAEMADEVSQHRRRGDRRESSRSGTESSPGERNGVQIRRDIHTGWWGRRGLQRTERVDMSYTTDWVGGETALRREPVMTVKLERR